jgi:hypothetical protein
MPRIRASLFVLALSAASAFGQGYTVRSTGYYLPTVGGTYSYSLGRPTVLMADPWGRTYEMPLQPKVLYYDTPFITPNGLYRPTTITVMPNSRPPVAARVPSVRTEPPPTARPPRIPPASGNGATFRYDGGTRRAPDTGPPPPAPMPPKAVDSAPPSVPPPVPTPPKVVEFPVPAPPAAQPKTGELPAIPSVPTLPDVPKVPGSVVEPLKSPAVPNLGPAPKD